jgi:hypothetical protein
VNPGVVDPGVIDDMMRAEDPALFDVAEQYFPGATASAGKKRLFRLTREQLDRTTAALVPKSYADSIMAVMPSDPLQTNYEYSEILNWNAASLTPYASWVSAIAARVEADPGSVIGCASANDTPCLQNGARQFVSRAFRGIATPALLDRYATFYTTSAAERGLAQATADLVDVTLTSPSYTFRDEVTTDDSGALLPAQLLQQLAYVLTDAPPEALQLAADRTAAEQIDAVLADPLAREKLMRFFVAWLEIKAPADFGLSASVFPEWTETVAEAAVEDTKTFLLRALAAPAPSLKAITQATEAFASPESDFLYDQDVSASATPITLPPAERFGIFTQPAVLASHSGPTTSRLVKRGVFFTRKIMCQPLGAPPDGVNTMVPTTPNSTERERIASITSVQPCLGCHTFINPFGFMQESFDAMGRFRTVDEEDLPIDPSITIDFLDEGPLSAMTSVDALRGITASVRFKQCFTRQMFRFYMGREEEPGDDPVLRQMFFSFAKNDQQDILAALKALVTSSSFNQRTETP